MQEYRRVAFGLFLMACVTGSVLFIGTLVGVPNSVLTVVGLVTLIMTGRYLEPIMEPRSERKRQR